MPEIPRELSSHWGSMENRWDWFFVTVLTGLLAFLPYSLGAVEGWSQLIVVLAASSLSIGLVLRVCLDPGFRFLWSWVYLPLLAIFSLIILQLLPLPTRLVEAISPETIAIRERFIGDLSEPIGRWVTFSLYRYETFHDLRMAMTFAVVFIAVASFTRTKLQIKRVLWIVFAVGCLEAMVALLQILTLSRSIHWMFAEGGNVVTSGSFINYSHFCQFMNLAIGAGVALVLVRMREDGRRGRGQASRINDLRGERYLRPLAGLVLCVVTVFTSMSRNGVLSLLVAACAIAVLIYRRGIVSVRGWLFGFVPLCTLLVLFFGYFDAVYNRFADLQQQGHLGDRWELTASTISVWEDFPVFGTGLGTHEYVFPLYDKTAATRMAEHADNDWAQLFEEFGLLGGGAVVAFVVSIFCLAGRLMLRGRTSLSTAAFGLSVGLFATAWHSLSDFGQHLPGVFVMTAVISGLIVAVVRYERQKTQDGSTRIRNEYAEPHRGPLGKTLIAVTAIMVIACAAWMIHGALAKYRGEEWSNTAFALEQNLQANDWIGNEQDFADLLTAAEYAFDSEPGNVKHAYLLNLYRWRAISPMLQQEANSDLRRNAISLVERLVRELSEVRRICPMYGPTFGLEGELRYIVLKEEVGRLLIDLAAKLTPYHSGTNFSAGKLAASEQRWDEAKELFRRSLELEPSRFKAVADFYVNTLKRPKDAEALIDSRYDRIVALLNSLEAAEFEVPWNADYVEKLRARSVELLRDRVSSGKAPASIAAELASIEATNGQKDTAIRLLRDALTMEYDRLHWRLSLAQLLLDTNQYEQAIREAKIVLRLNPESVKAAKIVHKCEQLLGEVPQN